MASKKPTSPSQELSADLRDKLNSILNKPPRPLVQDDLPTIAAAVEEYRRAWQSKEGEHETLLCAAVISEAGEKLLAKIMPPNITPAEFPPSAGTSWVEWLERGRYGVHTRDVCESIEESALPDAVLDEIRELRNYLCSMRSAYRGKTDRQIVSKARTARGLSPPAGA